mmetsp:Transcript_22651/g.25507  ORF Transcript_22651/g.25507 Transcript_22651/m.25507 type:complete len:494 (+) Transcript_22651:312-1793(+)
MKVVILGLLLLVATCTAERPSLKIEDWQGRYIVQFKKECQSKGLKSVVEAAIPGEDSLFLEHVNAYIVKTPKLKIGQAIQITSVEDSLLKDCVASIEEDRLHTLEETPTTAQSELIIDPETKEASVNPEFNFYYAWHLDRINARQGLDQDSTVQFSTTNESDVYIIDSGIDRHHIWLEDRCAPSDSDHFVAFDDTDDCGFYACDKNTHGTHVSGLVASDLYGYNPNATLHAVKVFNYSGRTTTSVILNGIDWVISYSSTKSTPASVNMSLGGGYDSQLNSGVAELVANNVNVAVAAGNETSDACSKSPASESTVLTIGATEQDDSMAWFSNFGSCVDFFAPGLDIVSTLPNNYVGTKSGTSMATPIVVGFMSAVAASQSSYFKDVPAVQTAIKDILTTNAVIGTSTNNDLIYGGYTLSNATEAVVETANTDVVEPDQVVETRKTPEIVEDSSSNFFRYTFIAVCLAAVGFVAYKRNTTGKKNTLIEENYGKMI